MRLKALTLGRTVGLQDCSGETCSLNEEQQLRRQQSCLLPQGTDTVRKDCCTPEGRAGCEGSLAACFSGAFVSRVLVSTGCQFLACWSLRVANFSCTCLKGLQISCVLVSKSVALLARTHGVLDERAASEATLPIPSTLCLNNNEFE